MSAVRDGAQLSAMPWVPCAQLMTGRPPRAPRSVGATTTPDTATSEPSMAREWYRTFQALAPGMPLNGALQISVTGIG